jgi:5-methyltetrahydrofolate--homocysteine methyltransferase
MARTIRVGEGFERTGSGILELVEAYHVGRLKRYEKGQVLYWQGDPGNHVFVVREGKVKVLSVSRQGKAHTYEILGAGRLVGAIAVLLGGEHESTAEALRHTDVYVIPVAEFEHLLVTDSTFSMAVMRELAQTARLLTSQARDLSLMDVPQRLKHGLVRLAGEHGLVTERGVKLDLEITHEEIAELVAANRSTVTACLNELKRQGYLWKEGRRLVILLPEHIEILDSLSQAVVQGNAQEATHRARKAVEERVDPIRALDALTCGMKEVDKGFAREELALPDVVMAAFAMKSAMPIVEGEIKRTGRQLGALGTIVIGTVHGDIHDIGKTMVAMLLMTEGFKVIDLGVNVTAEQFVEAIREHRPDIVAMSALTTMTAPEQAKVVTVLKEEGLRDKVKIMVGGGAITQALAEDIEADGYEPTACGAVGLAKRLIGVE